MPNWCFTNYVIEGDKEEIADLMQKLESLEQRDIPLVENGFGKNWLGCVIVLFAGDWNDFDCRGNFMELERLGDTTLRFDTETAWSEMSDVWKFVCGKYKSLKYCFLAEEPGCCYYATNDTDRKYFPDRFFVEQGDMERQCHESEQSLFRDISERTGVEIKSLKKLQKVIDAYNDTHEDNEIYVYEFSMVE